MKPGPQHGSPRYINEEMLGGKLLAENTSWQGNGSLVTLSPLGGGAIGGS